MEEKVRLRVKACARTSESKVGYCLGHILEEWVSQSCFCRNSLIGVVVQHLLEEEMYEVFSDKRVTKWAAGVLRKQENRTPFTQVSFPSSHI